MERPGVPGVGTAPPPEWRYPAGRRTRSRRRAPRYDRGVALIGLWHGSVTSNLVRALPNGEWRVTTASLPASGSIPDPGVWVHRRGARPLARLGSTGRLARWSPSDVALVVEVADSSLTADLETKARVYGQSGYPTYWVVHRGGVAVLTDPYEAGYRRQQTVAPGDAVAVPYAPGATLDVALLLDAEE